MSESRRIVVGRSPGKADRTYRVLEKLGEGSGGEVWKADYLPGDTDAAGTHQVALKVAHAAPKWQSKLIEEHTALRRVADAHAGATTQDSRRTHRIVRLNHPHVLALDWGPETRTAIELEVLNGDTLLAWFHGRWAGKAHLPWQDRVARVVEDGIQLTEALLQLQAVEGMMHRDLKPSNVMRTQGRGLMLFDFNVAKTVDESDHTQVGTRGYCAPEILAGEAHDATADLYSLGVMLFELVHHRRFNRGHDVAGDTLTWPTPEVGTFPPALRDGLGDLLGGLITTRPHRISSAQRVLDDLLALRDVAFPTTDEGPAAVDMISLLFELRPSGLAAVVTDTSRDVHDQHLQAYLRERMAVEDDLEDWLVRQVEEAAASTSDAPVLIMLSGNAGDGKSHLIRRLVRHHFKDRPEILDQIERIADATHAPDPTQGHHDRLLAFFRPLLPGAPAPERKIRLIAMNTGMVISFFDAHRDEMGPLRAELFRRLGLLQDPTEANYPRKLLVVNLDLRRLVNAEAHEASFFDRMLDRLNPLKDGSITEPKWAACQTCPARALCPVRFNLEALTHERPRHALRSLLRRCDLDAEVHLSPRNLWGFLYRLTTGGTHRYDTGGSDAPCDVVRRKADASDGDWLLAGQFTEVLFRAPEADHLWATLHARDPAYASVDAIDEWHTRLSISPALDHHPKVVERLGGHDALLHGLDLSTLLQQLEHERSATRRNAAVRRHVFFLDDVFEAWRATESGEDFREILAAYAAYSRDPGRVPPHYRSALKTLVGLLHTVFVSGQGRSIGEARYLPVSKPNVQSHVELLVRLDETQATKRLALGAVLPCDMHTCVHEDRLSLLDLLGYEPTVVHLAIQGARLAVDFDLFLFLSRVQEGQRPTSSDLAEFQAIRFVRERIANDLAKEQDEVGLFIHDPDLGETHRLHQDAFGDHILERVTR